MVKRISLILLLFPAILIADTRSYWVIGSFEREAGAISEQQRLSQLLAAPVTIRFAEHRGTYRLLVDVRDVDKETLNAHNVGAWSFSEAVPATADTSKPDGSTSARIDRHSEEEPEQTVAPEPTKASSAPAAISYTEPHPEPSRYPAFNENESFAEYCDRVPDVPLCRHPKLRWALEKEAQLNRHYDELKDWCQRQNDSKAQDICLESLPVN